ncbi:MAG: GAF domain-containing protein [Anaerolineae bacterium]
MISEKGWSSYLPTATVLISVAIVATFAYEFLVVGRDTTVALVLLGIITLISFLLIAFLFAAYVSSKKELALYRDQSDDLKQNGRFMQDMLNRQQEIQGELLARQDLSDRLLRMVRSTAMTTSLEVALEKILDAACTTTHAEGGSLLLVDSGGKVTNSYLSRRSNKRDESKKLVGQVMRDGLASWIFRTGQAVILNDAGNDERWITLPDAPYEAGSVLGVPINSGTVVTGILTLIHQRKNHFRDDDLGLMQDAASQIALAVRNSQIFEEQKRMVDRQTSLYDVLQLISQKLTPGSVEISTVKKVTELTGWSTAVILRVDETGKYLVPVAREGIHPPATHYKVGLDATTAAGESFTQNKRVEIINTLGLATHTPLNPKSRSEVYVPIQKRGVVDGVLAFGDSRPYAFSEDEVTLIESISEATSLAITNAYLFQEISEQQGRLEALINSSNDGIILVGQNQDILVVNQPALNLLNLYQQPTEWLGKSVSELSKNLLKAGYSEFAQRFSNQLVSIESADPDSFEVVSEEYDIASNVITISFLPVVGEDEYIGYLCIIRDITEEKLLTRMRDDLTHSIVHDLKNPLWMLDTGLKLLTDTLNSQDALGESETQMLDISSAQVERMLGLVNAILDISRLEDRKMPLSREIFDIRSSIKESMQLMVPEAQKKNVTIESNCAELTGLVTVDADKDLISRVFQNLLGNSLKFTPEEGNIRISCEINRELKIIDIRIKDTGPGISSSMTTHIFEKFATGDHDESGSGLGLAFCKMAVEAHGGTIEVEETSAGGTTFRFSLPLTH